MCWDTASQTFAYQVPLFTSGWSGGRKGMSSPQPTHENIFHCRLCYTILLCLVSVRPVLETEIQMQGTLVCLMYLYVCWLCLAQCLCSTWVVEKCRPGYVMAGVAVCLEFPVGLPRHSRKTEQVGVWSSSCLTLAHHWISDTDIFLREIPFLKLKTLFSICLSVCHTELLSWLSEWV